MEDQSSRQHPLEEPAEGARQARQGNQTQDPPLQQDQAEGEPQDTNAPPAANTP